MTQSFLNAPYPFIDSAGDNIVAITPLNTSGFDQWVKEQDEPTRLQIEQAGFDGKTGGSAVIRDASGVVTAILMGCGVDFNIHSSSAIYALIQSRFGADFIQSVKFKIREGDIDEASIDKICIGWGLAAYKFDAHKKDEHADKRPTLIWPDNADKEFVNAQIASICLIRDLINTPPNILGTNELAGAASEVAKHFKAKINIIKGDKLEKEFPLIHTVGKASPRPPQLVDMTWGKKSDPKVTIVGKGIIYDTGGLNLKPGMYMRDMKKDMGGAAHALGLAWMIMSQNLPVQLRVLIPIAENSVAGNSYRPGDILESRKGLSVEIGDTDAEGRLVVADALCYASEDKPDFMVDFCTLTGAARVALGYDIPAFFSNDEGIIDSLRKTSVKDNDPVWPLPLWQGYMKDIETPIADITNDGSGRAGAIYGGLFLQRFVNENINWVHVDCYAWEQAGKAGRPKGGADTGMRALYSHIKDRYTGQMILTVITPTADILGNPQEPNMISNADSQLLYGETFEVLASHGAYVLGKGTLDGYEGYVERGQLVKNAPVSNAVITAPSSHLYDMPDFKSRPIMPLSFFSRVYASGETENGFAKITDGWVYTQHVQELNTLSLHKDLADIALQFYGSPYLFAGRSRFGIDCSGLVQMAIMGLGHACPPRDTKDQQKNIGKPVKREELKRNDIVYFKGHVGIMIDDTHILNATARFMGTVIEPLEDLEKAYKGIKDIRRLS